MFDPVTGSIGSISVMTTNGRGFTAEEIAERALDKIIYVGSDAHPVLREQAEAFKDNIRHILIFYMNEAMRSRNVTLVNKFREAGFPEMIPILDL